LIWRFTKILYKENEKMNVEDDLNPSKIVSLKERKNNKNDKLKTNPSLSTYQSTYQKLLDIIESSKATLDSLEDCQIQLKKSQTQQETFFSSMAEAINQIEKKCLEAMEAVERATIMWQKRAAEMRAITEKAKRRLQLFAVMTLIMAGFFAALTIAI
jgi:hypothetical protein